jgi:hypothetical protein
MHRCTQGRRGYKGKRGKKNWPKQASLDLDPIIGPQVPSSMRSCPGLMLLGLVAVLGQGPQCDKTSFQTDLTDWQCLGLDGWAKGEGPQTPDACMQECCNRGPNQCGIWQFAAGNDIGTDHERGGCWVGDQHIGCVPYKVSVKLSFRSSY